MLLTCPQPPAVFLTPKTSRQPFWTRRTRFLTDNTTVNHSGPLLRILTHSQLPTLVSEHHNSFSKPYTRSTPSTLVPTPYTYSTPLTLAKHLPHSFQTSPDVLATFCRVVNPPDVFLTNNTHPQPFPSTSNSRNSFLTPTTCFRAAPLASDLRRPFLTKPAHSQPFSPILNFYTHLQLLFNYYPPFSTLNTHLNPSSSPTARRLPSTVPFQPFSLVLPVLIYFHISPLVLIRSHLIPFVFIYFYSFLFISSHSHPFSLAFIRSHPFSSLFTHLHLF